MDVDELICRWSKGDVTPNEESVLAAWRRSSPVNEEYFQELIRLLRVARSVRREEDHLEANLPPESSRLIQLAEASSLALPAGQPRTRWVGRVWWLAGGAVAASIVLAFAVRAGTTKRALASTFTFGAGEFVTGAAETATVSFGDGSVARLAPSSRLRVTGSPNEREVFLDGQAYFAVAKMEGHPFRVRTRAGDALALGTRFEIKVEGDRLRLVVVEGRVALAAGGKAVEVKGKQMSLITAGTVSSPVVATDVGPLVAWVGKFIVFQSTPLRDVATELGQAYGVKVNVLDSALAEQTITGWYTDRTFEEVLTLVCGVLQASCSVDQGVATIKR